jgi:hypothetical protein
METTFDGSSSILNTVKKLCGVSEEYTVFDQDLLVLINAAILDLTQNGVGPEDGFLVSDASATWDDFIQGFPNPGVIANYISQKVRILFDPPSSSFVLESIQKQLDELIWRINVQAESDS